MMKKIYTPQVNVNDEKVKITRWLVESGSYVHRGDEVVSLETNKSAIEVESEIDGYLFYQWETGSEVSVGALLGVIGEQPITEEELRRIFCSPTTKNEENPPRKITAKARKLMEEYGWTLDDFPGTEPVTTDLVKMRLEQSAPTEHTTRERPEKNLPRHLVELELTEAKKQEVQVLVSSHAQVVPSEVTIPVHFDRFENERDTLSKQFRFPFTIGDLASYSCARILLRYPELNGLYYLDKAYQYKTVNLGYAVNLGRGLCVPVIKNADKKERLDLAQEIRKYILKYSHDKILNKDCSQGTFTVTDLSSKNIIGFRPVLHSMQSAILGISMHPESKTIHLTLGFDHRIADGLLAADFLHELKGMIEGESTEKTVSSSLTGTSRMSKQEGTHEPSDRALTKDKGVVTQHQGDDEKKGIAPSEQDVASIISKVFYAVTKNELDENMPFFERGMTSLNMVEFVDQLEKRLHVTFRESDLFTYPTLQELAAHVTPESGWAVKKSADGSLEREALRSGVEEKPNYAIDIKTILSSVMTDELDIDAALKLINEEPAAISETREDGAEVEEVIGVRYCHGSEFVRSSVLPDTTETLRKHAIFSYHSTDAKIWRQRFREKIDQGEKVYLLGFQGIIHNSGVSLIEASKKAGIQILANYEEERFVGKKHFAGYPAESIRELKKLLTERGKTTNDIFCVLYGWDLVQLEKNAQQLKMGREKFAPNPLLDYMTLSMISEEAYKETYNPQRKDFYVHTPLLVRIYQRLMNDLELSHRVPCIQMLHHENHAYFSYGVSPFSGKKYRDQTTMIACIDGTGDLSSTSLYRAKGTEIELIKRLPMMDSVGDFYGLLACFLGGWTPLSSEGRYMGAAAWGNDSRLTNPYYKRLRQFFYFAGNGDVFVNSAMVANEYADLEDIVGPLLQIEDLWNPDAVLHVNNLEHSQITRERVDKAAAVQMVFEDVVCHIIAYLIDETQSDQLVLCGGTALNCVANMRLVEHFNQKYYQKYLGKNTQLNIWVPPIPSDQGVVIGAPYQFAMRNGADPLGELPTPFLCGLSPRTESIRQALEKTDFLLYDELGNLHEEEVRAKVADWMAYIVSQDGVIGIFQGEAETGPRALGHRSLLSNPCNPNTLEVLNSRIKLRERIRPLAPMVTLAAAKKWFTLSSGARAKNYNAYDYMVLTVEVRAEAKALIPAVIHCDGTSRIQIVRKENNRLMHEYLKALGKYIGVEISVNTSLNVGSPIVQRPDQALEIFKRAKGLDGMFLVGDGGEVFMVWAKEGIQKFDSCLPTLRKVYWGTEKGNPILK